MRKIIFGSEEWNKFWRGRQWTKDQQLELEAATEDRKPPAFVVNLLKPMSK